jgi:hypothetical protein
MLSIWSRNMPSRKWFMLGQEPRLGKDLGGGKAMEAAKWKTLRSRAMTTFD